MLYRCFLDSTQKHFSKNDPDKSLTYIAVPSYNDKSISYNILLFDFIEIDKISLIDILGIDLIKHHLSDSLFDDLKSVSDIIDVFKMPANLILPFSMQPIESETDLSKIIDRFFIDNIKKNHGNNIGSKNYFHSNYK